MQNFGEQTKSIMVSLKMDYSVAFSNQSQEKNPKAHAFPYSAAARTGPY